MSFKYKQFANTGTGKYNTINDKLAHRKWVDMLRRCYGNENPSYINCTVCKEWLSFQNFAKWYYENYVNGWFLDKDILIEGNKIYSPETCCFVPHLINSQFKEITTNDLPRGVRKNFNKFIARINYKHLGSFETLQEAQEVAHKERVKYIRELALIFKNDLSITVFNKLSNYE